MRPSTTTNSTFAGAAEWSLGHFIQLYGRKPAVADNFGRRNGDQ
jgi:hypothetical protein